MAKKKRDAHQCLCGGGTIEIESNLVGYKVLCVDCGVSGKSDLNITVARLVQQVNKRGEND